MENNIPTNQLETIFKETEDDLRPLLKRIALMRYKQKQFFKTKSPIHLREAQALEKEIDTWLQDRLYFEGLDEKKEGQLNLFLS